jgi:ubiquitin-like domain-containing CTD phosphatase 1
MHQTAAYEHYDIIIWSATSLKWIELKMKELGVSSNPNYKLTAMFDDRGMITVTSSKYGLFNCKPLQVVWDKYADFYGPKNTIMFDDLGRNFIMNPQNVASPFFVSLA